MIPGTLKVSRGRFTFATLIDEMVGIPKGVEFFETMVGNIVVDGLDRPLSFSARLAAPWRNCLMRGRFELRGVLEAQGFADGVDISGELEIRPFHRDFFVINLISLPTMATLTVFLVKNSDNCCTP